MPASQRQPATTFLLILCIGFLSCGGIDCRADAAQISHSVAHATGSIRPAAGRVAPATAPAAPNPAIDGQPPERPAVDLGTLVYRKLLKPLLRLTLFIAIGLFVGNLIEALQWTRQLGRVTRPLIRWGRLNDHSAVAFMAAFFSGVTANTLLVNAYKDRAITRKELFFSNLINTLPSFFLHLPTTFFILLPLVREAGVLYLACTLSAAILRTLTILTVSRITLPTRDLEPVKLPANSGETGLWRTTWEKFKRRFRRILIWTIPIYTLFFFLNQFGAFRWLERGLAGLFSFTIVPVEALTIIAFQVMAEFTAGAAAAGALLAAGTLSIKQTVLALLIGNVISTPVRALRHQLPYYMGIFTPRLGIYLLSVGQLVRASSVVLALFLFYWLYPG